MSNAPIRILHVVGGMNRAGGVQSGLMHLLRHIDRSRFQIDFLVEDDQPQDYQSEIEELGGRIIVCTEPRSPSRYASNFREVLSSYGPYDIIHSHVGFRNGFMMKLAKDAGIPVRISHSHSAFDNANKSLKRKLYAALQKNWISKCATAGIGVSEKAAITMFGRNWQQNRKWRLMSWCVIDSRDYMSSPSRSEVLSELGIPEDSLVIGHVGRLTEVKNHAFMLEIAEELHNRLPNVFFVFVGDGPLHNDIQSQISQKELGAYVKLVGARNDVPRLMTGAFDAVILPSFWEGMPLVMIEAQAAGLPCFISDVIAKEADVVAGLVHRLPLSLGATGWAKEIAETLSAAPCISCSEAAALVTSSQYDVTQSVKALAQLYEKLYACQAIEGVCSCQK